MGAEEVHTKMELDLISPQWVLIKIHQIAVLMSNQNRINYYSPVDTL